MKYFSMLIGLIYCLLSSAPAYSQNLNFPTTAHDFGVFAEDGGQVSTSFAFTNESASAQVIVSVDSSCGCTVPKFSMQPIAPGQSSTIDVTYDPAGRPGQFLRTIKVIVAPENKVYVLSISGDVTPRAKTVEEEYPFDMGRGLRFATNYYALSLIEQGERVETRVEYINTSGKELQFSVRAKSKSGLLQMVDVPHSIAAGERGNFGIAYDLSGGKEVYGELNDRYYIDINGKESKYMLIVNGHGVDSFTEQQRSAPAIFDVSTRTIRVGETVKNKRSERKTFTIENSGIEQLVMRNVECGKGLHTTIKTGQVIAAGKSIEVEVWVDTTGFEYGAFSRFLTLTVNDPDRAVQRIRVAGFVVK